MEKIGFRISELLKSKGITAYELSDVTGISQATLSRIINKNTKPNIRNSEILSKYFNVSKEWLLNGTGEMEGFKKENSQQNEESFLQKHYDKILMQKDQFLDSVLKDNERLRKELDLMRSNNNKN